MEKIAKLTFIELIYWYTIFVLFFYIGVTPDIFSSLKASGLPALAITILSKVLQFILAKTIKS